MKESNRTTDVRDAKLATARKTEKKFSWFRTTIQNRDSEGSQNFESKKKQRRKKIVDSENQPDIATFSRYSALYIQMLYVLDAQESKERKVIVTPLG